MGGLLIIILTNGNDNNNHHWPKTKYLIFHFIMFAPQNNSIKQIIFSSFFTTKEVEHKKVQQLICQLTAGEYHKNLKTGLWTSKLPFAMLNQATYFFHSFVHSKIIMLSEFLCLLSVSLVHCVGLCFVLLASLRIFSFFGKTFIYLAVPGLSCVTWDLLVGACELLVGI